MKKESVTSPITFFSGLTLSLYFLLLGFYFYFLSLIPLLVFLSLNMLTYVAFCVFTSHLPLWGDKCDKLMFLSVSSNEIVAWLGNGKHLFIKMWAWAYSINIHTRVWGSSCRNHCGGAITNDNVAKTGPNGLFRVLNTLTNSFFTKLQ